MFLFFRGMIIITIFVKNRSKKLWEILLPRNSLDYNL